MNLLHAPRRLSLAVSAGLSVAVLAGAPAALADSLAVSVIPAAPLGPFVPGVSTSYMTSAAATVTTPTAATLTIVDDSGVGVPGELYNAAAASSLDAPLQVSASSMAPGAAGGPFAPLSATPVTLITYAQPVTNDPVTIDLMQPIGATEGLRTGTYSKTLTVTLTEGP